MKITNESIDRAYRLVYEFYANAVNSSKSPTIRNPFPYDFITMLAEARFTNGPFGGKAAWREEAK